MPYIRNDWETFDSNAVRLKDGLAAAFYRSKDMECYFCKKQTDKLYDLRGWKVCYDCYFEDIDNTLGKEDEDNEQALKGQK